MKYTREQTLLLQNALQSLPGYEATKCYFAMRYWHPFTDAVVSQMQSDGIDKFVVLPLYPQFSISTSGSSLRILKELFMSPSTTLGKAPHTVVPYWYHRPEYIHTVAKLVVEKLHEFTPAELAQNNGEIHVLFSAHGVPEYYITRENDPYQLHIQECTQLIEQEVRRMLSTTTTAAAAAPVDVRITAHHENVVVCEAPTTTTTSSSTEPHSAIASRSTTPPKIRFHLSFQSRVGPIKWLQPYTEDMLDYLGKQQQVKNLVVIPISFVSEHIETLEEIDQEYQEIAHEKGILNWKRVPALNVDPDFIHALKNVVVSIEQNKIIFPF